MKTILVLSLLFSLSAFARHGTPEISRQIREDIELRDSKLLALAKQKIELPVSRGLAQGESDLCWVYATLSMLESNYLVRHPTSKIELSRGYMQYRAMEDRFLNFIHANQDSMNEGGLEIEAVSIIRKMGIVSFKDYHDILDSAPVYQDIRRKLKAASGSGRMQILDDELKKFFNPLPNSTTLDGKRFVPLLLSREVLMNNDWVELSASTTQEGWGREPDADSRPESVTYFSKKAKLYKAMKASLENGYAFTWGTKEHAMMIYGAEYDEDGKPLVYYVKDSYTPFFYKAEAPKLHRQMVEVTVLKKFLPH